jgi:hypothetical protein
MNKILMCLAVSTAAFSVTRAAEAIVKWRDARNK